jgi:hypothetical protein
VKRASKVDGQEHVAACRMRRIEPLRLQTRSSAIGRGGGRGVPSFLQASSQCSQYPGILWQCQVGFQRAFSLHVA